MSHILKFLKPVDGIRGNDLLIPLLLGAISFFIAVGPLPLNPFNIDWLVGWDPQQEYYGWAIYRNGPWQLPLGLNPNFGMEFGSSIVYADSIPLLAIFFKTINFALPIHFQYFGIWNLICFIFQAIFAWMLLRIFTKDTLVLIFSTCLFVFSPPFLWKIGSSNSLISQFLILAAIYLTLSKNFHRAFIQWLLLLIIAEGIHFYIFAMICVLWIANVFQRVWIEKVLSFSSAVIQIAITLIFILIAGWQFGYFAVGTGSAATGNYGYGAMNLLALFNSSGWSYFIPSIPQTPFNFAQSNLILSNVEGMNYLGAGSILVLAFAIFGVIKNQSFKIDWFKKYPFTFLGLLGLFILALSNKIGIGPWNFSFPLPDKIVGIASMFRASGRMFWPVYYSIVLCSLVLVFRLYKKNHVVLLLACCAFIQVLDTRSQWSIEKNVLTLASNQAKSSPLTSSFWEVAGKKYQTVIRLPAKNNLYDWTIFAAYAAKYQMATNSAFLARYDQDKLEAMNQSLEKEVYAGKYRANSLYIIENGNIVQVLRSLNSSKDLFARIDGYNVLAPGWMDCGDCVLPENIEQFSGLIDRLRKIRTFTFSDKDVDRISLSLLSKGWGNPEPWGVWSSAREASITIPFDGRNESVLKLELRALISKNLSAQNIQISANGHNLGSFTLHKGAGNLVEIKVPSQLQKEEFITLNFYLPNAARPIDLGITADDERLLSIGLVSAKWY